MERFDREHLARKVSLELNVKDIFDRQQIAGDPGVRLFDRQVFIIILKLLKLIQTQTSMFLLPFIIHVCVFAKINCIFSAPVYTVPQHSTFHHSLPYQHFDCSEGR